MARVVLARTGNLSVPLPMMAFATRCWLHVVTRANRCDQKLNLPIPVSKVSCHLANKMSANVWHTLYVDQDDTTCCGHDYNQVAPSGTKSGSKPLCLDFWDVTFLQPSGTKWIQVDPNQDPSHFAWNSETTLFYNQVDPSGSESGSELFAWNSGQNHLRPVS